MTKPKKFFIIIPHSGKNGFKSTIKMRGRRFSLLKLFLWYTYAFGSNHRNIKISSDAQKFEESFKIFWRNLVGIRRNAQNHIRYHPTDSSSSNHTEEIPKKLVNETIKKKKKKKTRSTCQEPDLAPLAVITHKKGVLLTMVHWLEPGTSGTYRLVSFPSKFTLSMAFFRRLYSSLPFRINQKLATIFQIPYSRLVRLFGRQPPVIIIIIIK